MRRISKAIAAFVLAASTASGLAACSAKVPVVIGQDELVDEQAIDGAATEEGQGAAEAADGAETQTRPGTDTTDADRKAWKSVAKNDGRIIANVVDIVPASGYDLDVDALLADLDASRVMWTHVVVGDNMSTKETEHAYLHLMSNADSSQVAQAISALDSRKWSAREMGVAEYGAYVDGPHDAYTYAETTYPGPAAE